MSDSARVSGWSSADLLRMVQQPDWPSPVLDTKVRGTEVRRIMQGNKAQIEKSYRGSLARYQQHENEFIGRLSNIPGLEEHLAHWSGTTRSATLHQRCLYTEWSGLDLLQWQTLLGARNPLTNSVPGVLYLVRCILDACQAFHDMGYVHNDLHFGNLTLDYRYDWHSHSVTLLPQQIRLIDFEFACYPRADHPRAQPGVFPARPTGWQDEHGAPELIDPHWHSPHVCPAEVEWVVPVDGDKRGYFRYRCTADGALNYRPVALDNIDFGVDFFTLGQALDGLLLDVEMSWDDQQTLGWATAEAFLRQLPDQLRAWDETVPEQIRAVPHAELIKQIDEHLGDWPNRADWRVALSGVRRWRIGKRARWIGGLVALGVVGGGLGLGRDWNPPPPKPEPLFTFAVLRESTGSALALAKDDSLSLIWNNKQYAGRLTKDGKFHFQLPPQARGQEVEILFQPKGKYEATRTHLVLGDAELNLPLRPTHPVLVKVFQSQGEITTAQVWIDEPPPIGRIKAEAAGSGSYILHVPLDLKHTTIEVCAPGFVATAKMLDLTQGPSAFKPHIKLEPATTPYPACPPK